MAELSETDFVDFVTLSDKQIDSKLESFKQENGETPAEFDAVLIILDTLVTEQNEDPYYPGASRHNINQALANLKLLQNDDDKLAEALLYATNSIEQTIDKVSNFEKVDEESKNNLIDNSYASCGVIDQFNKIGELKQNNSFKLVAEFLNYVKENEITR